MKNKTCISLLAVCALHLAHNAQANSAAAVEKTTYIKAENSLSTERLGATTLIPLKLLAQDTPQKQYLTEINNQYVANQKVDINNDGVLDTLLVIADYAPNASVEIKVTAPISGQLALTYPPLTQAEMGMRLGGVISAEGINSGGAYYPMSSMTLPPSHKIGDKLYKYEGFGWESDRVAYRFYFDERGLIDIFGKRIPNLVLDQVGLDKGDYHTLSDWGMDILKVGPSLGMGGAAGWLDGKVQHPNNLSNLSVTLDNGPLQSGAKVTQSGWKLGKKTLDFSRKFSIDAHSNLTHTQVTSSAAMGSLAIGIVKHGVAKLENITANSEWNYLATFGKQSLAEDALGMVVFFRHRDLQLITSDEFNELAILKMKTTADYYFGARWQGEAQSITTQEAFYDYLEKTRIELNTPINVSIDQQKH